MSDATAIRVPRLSAGWAVRLPILVLTAAILCLFLALPYRSLDADATTFGLMGNDLLRRGYLPTLPYGQNYLFSITPYVYALVRFLAPRLSETRALAVAGSLLSLSGLWLIVEGLLAIRRRPGRSAAVAAIVFCALVAAMPGYIFDLSRNSSIEVSLFLLGVVVFAAVRVERGLTAGLPVRQGAWFALGLALAHSLCSRPQVAVYAAAAAVPLLIRTRKDAARAGLFRALCAFGAGAAIGYLPMLLHELLRAPAWPFTHHIVPRLGPGRRIRAAAALFAGGIAPRTFDLAADRPLSACLTLLWIGWALAGFWRAAARKDAGVTPVDHAWFYGSLLTIAGMILMPRLSVDPESRRYCLHVVLAVGWLFCRFGLLSGRRMILPLAAVAALLGLSVPRWVSRLELERNADREVRAAKEALIPELQAYNTPILAGYWDAYLLAFLSDGKLKIEAYPWDLVRTYGLIPEAEMGRQTLWLVKCGYGQDTKQRLEEECGKEAVAGLKSRPTRHYLLDRECEIWTFPDGGEAVRLMKKFHPAYFSTRYPPGSGNAGPRPAGAAP